jgi:hypothetical protein
MRLELKVLQLFKFRPETTADGETEVHMNVKEMQGKKNFLTKKKRVRKCRWRQTWLKDKKKKIKKGSVSNRSQSNA